MNFLISGILGLLFGSFANAYFYRIARGISLATPRSFCPSCLSPIAWFDNIPVLSFILLKGKCRHCQAPISIQYPLVEIFCGVLFAGIVFRFGQPPWIVASFMLLFAYLVFLIGGVDLATYFQLDKKYGIIPDHLSIPLIIMGILISPINPVFDGNYLQCIFWGLGAAGALLVFRAAANWILKKESLGLGDVKMLTGVAIWLGGSGIFLTLLIGSSLGSLVSLALIGSKKMDRSASVPFGPFLAFGALCALFLS